MVREHKTRSAQSAESPAPTTTTFVRPYVVLCVPVLSETGGVRHVFWRKCLSPEMLSMSNRDHGEWARLNAWERSSMCVCGFSTLRSSVDPSGLLPAVFV